MRVESKEVSWCKKSGSGGGGDEESNKDFMQNNEWIENPKCYLYIPQPRKNIYVLNIII
jgi:hypothetical protein